MEDEMSIHFMKPGWAAAVVLGAALGAALLASPGLGAQQEEPGAGRRVTHKVVPLYPAVARRMHLEGTVRLSATVAPNGAVKSTKTLGGNAVLAIAADQAVSQWKYEVSTRETTEAVTLVFKDNQ
jgi:TonB family protein